MPVARGVTSRFGSILVLLFALGIAALAVLTSPGQPAAQPGDGLPAGKQSTRVAQLLGSFPSGTRGTALVVFERTDGPLTQADHAAIDALRTGLHIAIPAQTAPDGQAALVTVTLPEGAGDTAVEELRTTVHEGLPAGLTGQVTGGPAFARDIAAAFDGADFTLLAATAAVVALLLLVTYRSPVLWLIPLLVIGVADQVVAKLLPWIAHLTGERTDASISGIVSVLVFGAGTDYALLLISRYREELRRTPDRREALAKAVRAAGPAVLASAATVILAVLTLLAADLVSNRTLGLSAALGVAVALLFGLVVLPAALACVPRAVFWPFTPHPGTRDRHGLWGRIAALVGRRPGAVLIAGTLLLLAVTTGLGQAKIGLKQTEVFRTKVESVTASEALARHFSAGAAQPLVVVVPAASAPSDAAALSSVEGVDQVGRPELSTDGSLAQVRVQVKGEAGSAEADATVKRVRDRLPGALVGGAPAEDLDQRDTALRDARVVGPLVLAVVLVVLILLLRALVAPVLLLLTVILSYAASLGAATYVFRLVGIPALDTAVPLLSFLFLVALGVDYNIFLVTRAREETLSRGGTPAGMARALTATGGVITSAGILLAAVFTVLGVLPVIALTQIGIIVGIGVLLDTLLVRTALVPAIGTLLGDRFWWPGGMRSSGGGSVRDIEGSRVPAEVVRSSDRP
ncbi:MMPL family transporter [Hamadaea tsunoensis]|uniref:MMPL family transporter n=1 Tax=Hamadaea tsunoensis TaxID=53368 RepID=UPI000421DBFF|nr:MMPL family transporter [Hamadaea tsunoensis]